MLPNKSIIYPIKTISSIGISVAGPNLAVQSIYKYLLTCLDTKYIFWTMPIH